MNEEIFESVMTHAMGLLEATTMAGRGRRGRRGRAGSLLVGTRGNNYGANGSNTS
ncbi:unnamed protein product [Bathycoccus prasinos]